MKAINEICRSALPGLLRPIVRFCIRNSLKQRELYEYIKTVFIQIAREELIKLDSTPTPSKLCAMTGIQRREVSRLLNSNPARKKSQDLISRVIGLWQGNPRYHDKQGKPKILDFSGREGAFAELVANVSTDLNPYTVAFELQRSQVAEQTEEGIQLLKRGYEPGTDAGASLQLLAEDSEYLYEAVVENIFSAQKVKNLHVKTEFDNIPASFEAEIRRWFLDRGGNFHKEARQYLSSLDRDVNPSMKERFENEPAICAVVGSFSLINQKEAVKNSKDK